MNLLTNTTTSKVVASIAVWFVVFLILVFGGFTFSPLEDWRWTTLGGLLLAAAAVVSALVCSSKDKIRVTHKVGSPNVETDAER